MNSDTTTTGTDELLSTRDVASLLGETPDTLIEWRTRRIGPRWLRLSWGRVRYSRAAVVAWLNGQEF